MLSGKKTYLVSAAITAFSLFGSQVTGVDVSAPSQITGVFVAAAFATLRAGLATLEKRLSAYVADAIDEAFDFEVVE